MRRPSIWNCDPADLLELEAEARGVTRERLVEEALRRYEAHLEAIGVRRDGVTREVGE